MSHPGLVVIDPPDSPDFLEKIPAGHRRQSNAHILLHHGIDPHSGAEGLFPFVNRHQVHSHG